VESKEMVLHVSMQRIIVRNMVGAEKVLLIKNLAKYRMEKIVKLKVHQ
jgi:hypothetical protein